MTSIFEDLFAAGSEVERLVTGFGFTEGPAWNAADGSLVFSDIPGNTMWKWSPGSGIAEYRQPSNKANGSFYDGDHCLITLESPRVVGFEVTRRIHH